MSKIGFSYSFQSKSEALKRALKRQGIKGFFNLLYRIRENKSLPEKTRYYPYSIQVETTTLCNLNCLMCSYKQKKINYQFKFDEFKQMIDSSPHVCLINMTGVGEPLLNDDFIKMVEYTKKQGIYVWFNDNFTLMTEEKIRKVIDTGVDTVAISFDGATKEIYEKIRRGAKFETTVKNIKNFIKIRGARVKPRLIMTTVLAKENIDDKKNIEEFAKENDIELVLTFNLFNVNRKQFPKEICSYPWNSCVITADKYVLPCCAIMYRQDLRDGENVKKWALGNVKEKTLAEIWNDSKYKELRKKLRKKEFPEMCQGCLK